MGAAVLVHVTMVPKSHRPPPGTESSCTVILAVAVADHWPLGSFRLALKTVMGGTGESPGGRAVTGIVGRTSFPNRSPKGAKEISDF